MNIVIAARTEKGLVRARNEDSYIVDRNNGVLVLADGVASCAAGHLASWLGVAISHSYLVSNLRMTGPPMDYEELLRAAVSRANTDISQIATLSGSRIPLLTTLVCALVVAPWLYYSSVGDTRIYLYGRSWGQAPRLQQITEDDNVAGEMIKSGRPPPIISQRHRNTLTKVIGSTAQLQPSSGKVALQEGDVLLLCTDGAYGLLDPKELSQIIESANFAPTAIVDGIIERCLNAGGPDNVTLIAARV